MSESCTALARAKINLTLRVASPDRTGLHPISSRAQSIDWADRLDVAIAEVDELLIDHPELPVEDNLVLAAREAVREATGDRRPVAIRLSKRLPIAAGLAGGSADAAATLHAVVRVLEADPHIVARLAPGIGADVPFCAIGGTARMEGHGEILTPLVVPGDHVYALVVPGFELSTPLVYRTWDMLGGPRAQPAPAGLLPPSLRDEEIANDLWPAAVHLVPELADWRTDLERRWARPVLMSGSGPTLFSAFRDPGEADSALGAVSGERRAAAVARPVARGVVVEQG